MKPFLSQRQAQALFSPRGIAIAGVSRNPSSLGRKVLGNLIKSGYKGEIYVLHPKAREIDGIPAFRNLGDIEGSVDMVVSLIPREGVKNLAEACVKRNVPILVVISAGFSEVGKEGEQLERDLINFAEENGLRIIGPNSMGVYSGVGHQGNQMDVTFTPIQPMKGNLAFLSQSGAIGAVMANHANQLGQGFSRFISLGNKPDIDENVLLEFLKNDSETDIIALYLESFTDGRMFIDKCREISISKPILAVKSGRTEAGARAAASHTGALATSDTIVESVFLQSGVIRANDIAELANMAYGLSKLQPMQGRNVAVISNAGGPGTIQTDELEAMGLKVMPISEKTRNQLKTFLPREASIGNPIDILPSASPDVYRQTVQTVLDSEDVNAVVVLILPPVLFPIDEMLDGIRQVNAAKPLIVVAMGCEGLIQNIADFPFPIFHLPREAAIVLKGAYLFQQFQTRRYVQTETPHPSGILKSCDSGWLNQETIEKLMQTYDILLAKQEVIENRSELKEVFERMAKPLVLKLLSDKLVHKSDAGGVITGIKSFEELREGFEELERLVENKGIEDGKYLVQEQLDNEIEIVIGGVRDPQFGPLVMVGTGGIFIELIKDAKFHIAPLSEKEAMNLIEQTNLGMILEGYRGRRSVDKRNLAKLIMKIGDMLYNEENIKELDLNPVLVHNDELIPVDIRIRI
ncbi:MAG: hypothetical protein D6732_07885 [Methanobacteriota archaeon]|nr:MAG: hypothetical protein D6732_07885 [Euryarchaeota archaeon]